ncbi:Nitroreductase-like protein [Aspergillus pseudoustus]|uniref:Nitroreductase-like protein n=1 Tax=Aspergillus pseudoustus TaxID=1810923 RepID=A0ABR4JF08_9EURO
MSASGNPFLAAIESRISCYSLTKTSPIPDSRLQEIVNTVIQHTPSPFNVQSARAVVLLHDNHDAFWDTADARVKESVPEAVYQALSQRIAGFKAAYGSVLFFEDQGALEELGSKNASVQHMLAEGSHHSSGMHQFAVWTALELEGLGCNLQHYNFLPSIVDAVKEKWNLPSTWALHAQLVFGAPDEAAGGLVRKRERTYLPLEERVRVLGA